MSLLKWLYVYLNFHVIARTFFVTKFFKGNSVRLTFPFFEMDTNFDDYNEDNFAIMMLKTVIDWESISEHQKYVIFLMCSKLFTQREVISTFKNKLGLKLSFEALSHCINRTAHSIYWTHGMSGGNMPYLCNQDLEALTVEIRERALSSIAFDTKTILDEAVVLRNLRRKKAMDVLKWFRCSKLSENVSRETIFSPTRQWINTIMEKVNAQLVKPIFVEGTRYYDCTVQIMNEYKERIHEIIRINNCCAELIFTADETSVDTNFKRKKIVPLMLRDFIEKEPESLPHITMMCSNNLVGVHPPLFMILKNRKTMPKELAPLVATGQIWVAANQSGWMDRWCFALWAIHMIPWIARFKEEMGPTYSRNNPLLIMDGHSSRTVPIALDLANNKDVRIFILPSHTSHVSQLFDVALASPLKRAFTDLFYQLINNGTNKVIERNGNENHAATLRKCAVEAFLQAWEITCTRTNCQAGAKEVALLFEKSFENHRFCREESEDELRKRKAEEREKESQKLYISNCLVTEKVEDVRDALNNDPFGSLSEDLDTFRTERDLVTFVIGEAKKHGSYLLGSNFRWGNAIFNDIIMSLSE